MQADTARVDRPARPDHHGRVPGTLDPASVAVRPRHSRMDALSHLGRGEDVRGAGRSADVCAVVAVGVAAAPLVRVGDLRITDPGPRRDGERLAALGDAGESRTIDVDRRRHDDRREPGALGGVAVRVRRRDADEDTRADVGCAERVGETRRRGDVDAVVSSRVAAAPLEGIRDRLAARPDTLVPRECLSEAGAAGNRRPLGVDGRIVGRQRRRHPHEEGEHGRQKDVASTKSAQRESAGEGRHGPGTGGTGHPSYEPASN